MNQHTVVRTWWMSPPRNLIENKLPLIVIESSCKMSRLLSFFFLKKGWALGEPRVDQFAHRERSVMSRRMESKEAEIHLLLVDSFTTGFHTYFISDAWLSSAAFPNSLSPSKHNKHAMPIYISATRRFWSLDQHSLSLSSPLAYIMTSDCDVSFCGSYTQRLVKWW